MCLVILILPLAQLMKNLKAKTFPAILRSFVRLARESAQDDENGSVLLR